MTPLTEHEKKQLRLLESQLHADDPKFVKTMRTKRSVSPWHRSGARNIMIAAAGFLVGIPSLVIGLVVPGAVALSITGLVVFLLGIYFAMAAIVLSENAVYMPKVKTGNFMANLEAKWDERKQNGF